MVFLESLTANVFFPVEKRVEDMPRRGTAIKDLFASQMLW